MTIKDTEFERFLSLFRSYNYQIEGLDRYSEEYFIASNDKYSIFCHYYGNDGYYKPLISAISFLSTDKNEIISEIEKNNKKSNYRNTHYKFPNIYTTYFVSKHKGYFCNHDYSFEEVEYLLKRELSE